MSSPAGAATHAIERRLYLLRHAEADMVDAGGRMWSEAEEPLTERGRAQAAELAALFAGVDVDRVHCSSMARARETAEIVAGDRPVEARPGLREIALGELEGGTARDVFAAAPGFLSDPDARLPGAESFREVAERVEREVAAVLDQDPGDDVVVVGHGAVNRALLGRLLGLGDDRALRLRQDWACVNVLERAGGRWWAGTINHAPGGLEELGMTRHVAALDEDMWRRLGR